MEDAPTAQKTSPFAPDVADQVHRPVPLTVTEAALEQVQAILAAEEDPEALALRVGISGSKGTEYLYDLSFEEKTAAEADDLVYLQGELTVIVPADSVDSLWGATLDVPSAAGSSGLVIRNPNRPDPVGVGGPIELSGTVRERVEQLLEQSINPSLAAHGGYASLQELIENDTKAVITMGGGCQGCAVSSMTLREGIQKSILEYIPEIVEVLDATDHAAGANPFYSEA